MNIAQVPSSEGLPDTHTAGDQSMDLLFIVKSTASSNQFATVNEKREIKRHAQVNASIRRKQEKQRKLQPAGGRLFKAFVRRDDLHISPQPRERALPAGASESSSPSQIVPSVRTHLDTAKIDPFNNGTTPMTPHMERVLSHYLTVLLPVIEPTMSERDDYTRWMLPLAAREPVLLYSLMFCMSRDLDLAFDDGFGRSRKQISAVENAKYGNNALAALQECLKSPETALRPSTIFAVHFLLWQEIFSGDDVDLDFLLRLIEKRGGFHGVQRKAFEGIMLGCFWRAIRTRSRPAIPVISVEIQISQKRRCEILSQCSSDVIQMGEGLLNSKLTDTFDEEMRELLQDARLVWICFEQIGIADCSTAERRQFTIDRSNIDHRFLSYPFDHFQGYRPIQETIRRAYVVFSSAHYNVVHPSSAVARCLVKDLKDALEATDLRSCWHHAAEMLLWVLFHGAHLSFGQLERPWFVNLLARVASFLRLNDWVLVRDILLRFYYVDRVFCQSFRRIWEEYHTAASLSEVVTTQLELASMVKTLP